MYYNFIYTWDKYRCYLLKSLTRFNLIIHCFYFKYSHNKPIIWWWLYLFYVLKYTNIFFVGFCYRIRFLWLCFKIFTFKYYVFSHVFKQHLKIMQEKYILWWLILWKSKFLFIKLHFYFISIKLQELLNYLLQNVVLLIISYKTTLKLNLFDWYQWPSDRVIQCVLNQWLWY
jgi:hypothetical protein